MEANYENLEKALADNAESISHLNTYNTLGYVSIGGYIVGGGLLIAGLASMKKDDPGPNAAFVGGAVTIGAAYLVNLIRGPFLKKAINIYNEY